MQLFTIFEPWLIPDKAYPPLSKGDLVRLSFRMVCTRLGSTQERQERFTHLDDAQYRFSGRVRLRYNERQGFIPFVIIECAGFRFYTSQTPGLQLSPSTWADGEGTLLLDYGDWAFHGLGGPSLLFDFRVVNIWKIPIPERDITRRKGEVSGPTFELPGAYDADSRQLVETMRDQPFHWLFYIMELDDVGLAGMNISPTFGRSQM
jgi:hypothetical protein